MRQRGSHWPRTGGVLFCAKGYGVMGLELIGAFTMIGIVIAMLVLVFHYLVP
jgi:hypothetical protein